MSEARNPPPASRIPRSASPTFSLRRQQVAELVALRAHVARALAVLRLHNRHPLVHAQTVALESDQLAGVVGDRANRMETEVEEDLRANAVIPQIGLEAKLLVGLHRVSAVILELVRLELVEEADAPPLLIQIHDDATPLDGDHLHRGVELPAAIAAQRMEHVSR